MTAYTGASGVLGSAVLKTFETAGHDVVGLGNSRATGKIQKVDLTKSDETDAFFNDFKPNCKRFLRSTNLPIVDDPNPQGLFTVLLNGGRTLRRRYVITKAERRSPS